MPQSPRYGVVFDFDGTLTPKSLGSLFKIVDTTALPPEAQPDFKVLRDRYIPLANTGKLSPGLQLELLAQTFEIYIRHRLTRDRWMAAIAGATRFRPGAIETLSALHAAGIPTAVISFGSTDFIEHALDLCGAGTCLTEIFATSMRHDADGLVIGYDPASFVTHENKGEWSREFAMAFGIGFENLLAVGDTAGDRRLGHLRQNRLGLAKDEEERSLLSPHMGMTAIAEDFTPARAWLSAKLGLPL
jgi:phosphoserine phosphatase